jgi:hypothetical protein
MAIGAGLLVKPDDFFGMAIHTGKRKAIRAILVTG